MSELSLNPCGILCDECNFYNNLCSGCRSQNGSPFWAKDHIEKGICPIYECSVNKYSFNNCGSCNKLPCSIFFELKDPNISEDEHKKSIADRVKKLKN